MMNTFWTDWFPCFGCTVEVEYFNDNVLFYEVGNDGKCVDVDFEDILTFDTVMETTYNVK